MAAHRLNVLLIEDNSEDARMTRESLSDAPFVNRLDVIGDGQLASDYLNELTEDNRPDMILLDLYLPKRTGFELMAEIQANPVLKNVPVVIVTASTANEQFLERFNVRPAACLSKPVDPFELSRVATVIAA